MSTAQWGFYFDLQRCVGCQTCEVVCKEWHGIPAGPVRWRRVETFEDGVFPDVAVVHLSLSCHHCERPSCVIACPTGAIRKRQEDGIVVVNRDSCLPNCQMCLRACPYQAPQFSPEDGRMQKCDFCIDRLQEGKAPLCVASCPLRALDAGPSAELEGRYEAVRTVTHFPDPSETGPSIVFRPRRARDDSSARPERRQ